MSNPPGQGPYPQYPQYGGYQPYDPYAMQRVSNGAARGAGIAQIIVGALGVLLAFCLLGVFGMLVRGVFTPEQQAELNSITGSEESLQTMLLAAGGCSGVPGLLLVILGAFVWRDAKWAIISSIALTSILLLLALAGTAAGLLGGEATAESVCANTIPLLVFAGLLIVQILALRGPRTPAGVQPWPQYYQPPTGMSGPFQSPPPVPPNSPTPPPPGRDDELPPPPVPPPPPSA